MHCTLGRQIQPPCLANDTTALKPPAYACADEYRNCRPGNVLAAIASRYKQAQGVVVDVMGVHINTGHCQVHSEPLNASHDSTVSAGAVYVY